jgi:hypothetical protein
MQRQRQMHQQKPRRISAAPRPHGAPASR